MEYTGSHDVAEALLSTQELAAPGFLPKLVCCRSICEAYAQLALCRGSLQMIVTTSSLQAVWAMEPHGRDVSLKTESAAPPDSRPPCIT